MDSSLYFLMIIGVINQILGIVFTYYAFKNVLRLKRAVTQYMIIAASVLFSIVSGVHCIVVYFSNFQAVFPILYVFFVIGFVLILTGEFYAGILIRKFVGKNPLFTILRTFSHTKYRLAGTFTLFLLIIPVWIVDSVARHMVMYELAVFLFLLISFVLFIIGEKKLYSMTSVLTDVVATVEGKNINLLRDDIAAVRVYTDIINMYLSVNTSPSSVMGNIVNDTLTKWSEEHPVLFGDCLTKEGNNIDPRIVIQNLDRLYEKGRLPLMLKEFSILTARLIVLYSHFTSPAYAIDRLTESYNAVKKRYGDVSILFDVLRTLPPGVLDEERVAFLSREELEKKVKERTMELMNANKELQIEIKDREKAEEQIRASLKEKEILLKEIHHRVKNNLQIISSLLDLQTEHFKDKRTLELFRDYRNRVKSMALIHEQLYQSKDLAKIDFNEYINNLAVTLFHLYGVNSDDVILKICIKDVFLSIETAIPCGLIINELVSNALKHAFPGGKKGEIQIDFHSDDGTFMLVVNDNGVGFPEKLDFRNTRSLGLQLVNMLTQQLKGTVDLERSHGTTFKITFKDIKNEERN
jgi:two-component sensor histidine kinase